MLGEKLPGSGQPPTAVGTTVATGRSALPRDQPRVVRVGRGDAQGEGQFGRPLSSLKPPGDPAPYLLGKTLHGLSLLTFFFTLKNILTSFYEENEKQAKLSERRRD